MCLIYDELGEGGIKVLTYSRSVSKQVNQDYINHNKHALDGGALLTDMTHIMRAIKNEPDVDVEVCHIKSHSIDMIDMHLIVGQGLNK